MQYDFVAFVYGRIIGKKILYISKEEFYAEHSSIELSPQSIKRMEENLEYQSWLVLCETRGKEIRLSDFLKKFVFKEKKTKEFFFKPLSRQNIKVYFIKHVEGRSFPTLVVYDIKRAPEST